jgi:hypothetical protein
MREELQMKTAFLLAAEHMRHRREVIKLNFYSSDPNIFIAFSPHLLLPPVAELAPINKSMIAKRNLQSLGRAKALFRNRY